MALKATVYKVRLDVADLDRNYYGNHSLTLARHPSETEHRLMARLLAFARFAGPGLAFTRGLCVDDEPELWDGGPDGVIHHWIELGTPAVDRIRKGCNRAGQVSVICYGERSAGVWWEKCRRDLTRFGNLDVYALGDRPLAALASGLSRSMKLQTTVQDGDMWVVTDNREAVLVNFDRWK